MNPPSDEMLQAFDRGLLPPEEIDAVGSWLEAHPEAEERLHCLEDENDAVVQALRGPCTLIDELSGLSDLTSNVVARVMSGSEDAASKTPEVPERIREYQIIRPLGSGGMGGVYLARHTRLQRQVALKFLLGDVASDPAYRARFEREMAVVGQLDHPHLIRAHDAGAEGDHLFLAMELLDGRDLAHVAAKGGPLPLADACEVVRQAALGLHYAHEHGLVHRDVKPANLYLTRSGIVKVIDLGLARATSGPLVAEGVSSAQTVLGTPECMAPEQWEQAAVDRRADLYALGCTLVILMTGRPPFQPESKSWVAWMDAHRGQPAPDLRERIPNAPAPLAELVAQLLAKDPQQRPATALQVAERLATWTTGHSLSKIDLCQTTVPGLSEAAYMARPTLPTPKRRPRWLALAAAVLVALLAAPLIWYAWNATRPSPSGQAKGTVPSPAPQSNSSNAGPSLHLFGPDHIELKNTAGMIDLNGAFTVEMWVQFGKGIHYFVGDESWPAVPPNPPVGQPGVTRTSGWVLRIQQDDRLNFAAAETSKEWFQARGPVIKFDDQWHHLAVSKDPKTLRLFLDGKLYLSEDTSDITFVNCPSNLFIGVREDPHQYRKVNSAFKAFRITANQLYGRDFIPPTQFTPAADTCVLLDFSAGAGRSLPDLSGNGNHGVITGGQWSSPPAPQRNSSNAAPSLHLFGPDHIELKNTAGMIDLNGAFTVEMWVQFASGDQSFVGDDSWPAAGQPGVKRSVGWVLRIWKDQRLNFTAAQTPGEWLDKDGAVVHYDDECHHLAVSKDAKVLRLFLDGKPYLKEDTSRITFVNCPSNLFIGVRTRAHYLRVVDCSFKAFRISNKALYTDASGFTPPRELTKTGDTLVLLDFSIAGGPIVPDQSGKGHDGVITGGQWR